MSAFHESEATRAQRPPEFRTSVPADMMLTWMKLQPDEPRPWAGDRIAEEAEAL